MPDAEKVKFKRGPSETLPQSIDPGSFLVETDTGQMYLDDTSENRVKIKDPSKLPLSGGELSGDVIFKGKASTSKEEFEDNEFVSKKYVSQTILDSQLVMEDF